MKVEVLYVAECPSHPAAVKLVRGILAAEGVETKIHEVLVRDEEMASELKFAGSPTIRINGRDVAGESRDLQSFTLSCRLYPGSKQVGLPPAEMIHRVVLKARQGPDHENGHGHLCLRAGNPEFCEGRVQVMTEHKGACCSSPAAMCYWFAASLIAWGVLSFIGLYWRPVHGSSAATVLFAMAISCTANWLRSRTFHCRITGHLFLIAAVVFLLSDSTMIHVNNILVWPFVIIGVGIAFLLEWRYTRLSAS